jgi:hypothetical protein
MSEKCEDYPDKTKKLSCYAKHAAASFKRSAIRATHWHGEQEGKHPWGYFLLALVILGGVFLAGGSILSYNFTVSNPTTPTAAQVTYDVTWRFSNGTAIPNNAAISGMITCTIQPSQSAVQESIRASYQRGPNPIGILITVPYYITGISVNIYSGSSASGTPQQVLPAAATSSYASAMQGWVSAWVQALWGSYSAVPDATPTLNPSWNVTLDTRTLANGIYTLQAAVQWGTAASVPALVVAPGPPPSLSSQMNGIVLLSASFFGSGLPVPEGSDYTWLCVFFAVVAIVIIIFLVKRR